MTTGDGGSDLGFAWRGPDGGGGAILSLSMLDAANGYGLFWVNPNGYAVARTSDGGRRWSDLYQWPAVR
jgi:hypothetical protein